MIYALVIVSIVLYPIIGVIIHGLYERQSLIKYGLSLQEKLDVVSKKGLSGHPEWTRLYWQKDFVEAVSVLWIVMPLLYIIRFIVRGIGKPTRFISSLFGALHKRVIYARLESNGASDTDKESGAYRSGADKEVEE